MIEVLISAPSLDTTVNVSGVSTVARELMTALVNEVSYRHITLGAPQKGNWFIRNVRSLRNIVSAFLQTVLRSADVFHSNTALNPKSIFRDLLFVMAARASGKRVLLHVHGGRYLDEPASGPTKAAIGALIRIADAVVVLSRTEKRVLCCRYPNAKSKARYIYNSIRANPDDITPIASFNPNSNSLLKIVFVGRLVPEKGLDVLLSAARELSKLPISITIYGDGPLRPLVENARKSTPNISYAGVFRHEGWSQTLGQYDVLLLPSLSGEGMPMVILEAMMLGIIPIATDLGSIREILGDGERGIILPTNNPAAVAAAARNCLTSPDVCRKMQVKCRAYAYENFDVLKNSQEFLILYNALSKKRR